MSLPRSHKFSCRSQSGSLDQVLEFPANFASTLSEDEVAPPPASGWLVVGCFQGVIERLGWAGHPLRKGQCCVIFYSFLFRLFLCVGGSTTQFLNKSPERLTFSFNNASHLLSAPGRGRSPLSFPLSLQQRSQCRCFFWDLSAEAERVGVSEEQKLL